MVRGIALRAPLLRASDGVPSLKFSFSNGGCPVTSKPATKTSLVAGLLEAQAGCRVEGGVLRVGVRRREGRPGGRGSWVGQAMDSPGGGGGLALGTPWSLASPHAVGADTPETVGRGGEWQQQPPPPPLPLPCAGAHSAGARFPADSIPSQQSPASQHGGEPSADEKALCAVMI